MIRFSWTKGLSTFRARIFWSVIPIILILFALVAAFNLRQHTRLVEEQFRKRGQVVASNLAYSSQLGVFAEDKQLLASSIRGVVGDPDVAYVYIYGEDGKILAKGGRQVSELMGLRKPSSSRTVNPSPRASRLPESASSSSSPPSSRRRGRCRMNC
jgi:uncharacterized membrane protein affecting hemolysin expression